MYCLLHCITYTYFYMHWYYCYMRRQINFIKYENAKICSFRIYFDMK